MSLGTIPEFQPIRGMLNTCFGSTYTKIGTIQRRLAWPLRKDNTQIREAFHIFSTFNFPVHSPQNSILLRREKIRGEDTSEHWKAGKCWVLRRILHREASAIKSQLICGEGKSPCGLMDKASDFESEDCGFESHRGHCFVIHRLTGQ